MMKMMRIALIAAAATLSLLPVALAQSRGEFDYFRDNIDDYSPCMTEHRVRQIFADKGYSNVKLNVPMGSFYQVKAVKDGRQVLIDYNTCGGGIMRTRQLGAS